MIFAAALFFKRQQKIPALLEAVVCLLYVFCQGVNFWGLFTIGHDCGHGAFSRYHSLNFVVGIATHSFILVPYEAWKFSHRLHHKNTGNIDREEVFYPQRKSEHSVVSRLMIVLLGGAWFIYESMGYPPRTEAHTELRDTMFRRHIISGTISIVAHLSCILGVLSLSAIVGWRVMGLYYWAPLFVFGSMLVVTMFLNHNDEETPWYADSEWTYVKGNLSIIDRDYGWIVSNLSHKIGTHQLHHLFPTIPHYNLIPATTHFRTAFPHLVRKSNEPILSAFFRIGKLYIKFGVVDENAKVFTLRDSAKQHSQ
ncbi:hypothetical protein Poli38472_013035 [Pythium oligandrum]|uniref:Fatty acid desaturase domain-containing protein n=1 Tax=Pythium oligandrum TaxID=41045 RepID=A0A8K1CK37_PYTOL|nr:hypothetical protein Poli38472_013035 [Pythium oligandrum]|eukprot:TMW64413.1 hypothetical protein Poli38472_013035 [Pythium oligandrum]